MDIKSNEISEILYNRKRNVLPDNEQFFNEMLNDFYNSDEFTKYKQLQDTKFYKDYRREKLPELSSDFLHKIYLFDSSFKELSNVSKLLICFLEYGYLKEDKNGFEIIHPKTYDFFNIHDTMEIKNIYGNYEGLVLPDGKYIPAYGGHSLLCAFSSLTGLDTKTCVRTLDLNGDFVFDDISTSYMDMTKPFLMNELQAKTLYQMNLTRTRPMEFNEALKISFQYHFKTKFEPNVRKKNLYVIEDALPDFVDAYEVMKEINTSERIERAVLNSLNK